MFTGDGLDGYIACTTPEELIEARKRGALSIQSSVNELAYLLYRERGRERNK